MSIKIALTDLEQALKYLRKHTTAYGVHLKSQDNMLTISTVDAGGQALELQLFDMDKSQSKARVILTESLDIVLKAKDGK